MSDFDEATATVSRPLYCGEFKPLDYKRLLPTTPRYVERDTPIIGMFDSSRSAMTARAPIPSPATKTPEQIAQAAENRRNGQLTKPHSIATRAIAAMRKKGAEWTPTAALVELSNAHMPEGCTPATPQRLYVSLAKSVRGGIVETRPVSVGSHYIEWRIKQ
jgi:hypothetical protein